MRGSRKRRRLWLVALLISVTSLAAIGLPSSSARTSVRPADAPATSPWQIVPAATDYNTLEANFDQPDTTLDGLSCTSDGTCMAIGADAGGGPDGATIPAAEQSTGGRWSMTPAPPYPVNGNANYYPLYGVSCASDTRCLAVGEDGGGALADVWDGTSWDSTAPVNTDSYDSLAGVSCPSTTTCYAVGESAPAGTVTYGNSDYEKSSELIEKYATATGAYVNPAAGVTESQWHSASPDADHTYTATWNADAGTVSVYKGSTELFTTDGTAGGFSPTGQAFVAEHQQGISDVVELFNLTDANPGSAIFTAGPTDTSSTVMWSPSGRYLVFGYTTEDGDITDTTFLAASTMFDNFRDATENAITLGPFPTYSAPGSGNNKFGSVSYGFAPDDSRFLFGSVAAGAQSVTWRWVDLAASSPTIHTYDMTSTSGYAQFSPGGAYLAFVSGSGSGSASVALFDSGSGADVGAAGPWASVSSLTLSATSGEEQVTVNGGQPDNLVANDDYAWSTMSAPAPPAPAGVETTFKSAELSSISCTSASNCVAVGTYAYSGYVKSQLTYDYGAVIEHWDGSTWTNVYKVDPTPTIFAGAGVQFGLASNRSGDISCVADGGTATGTACTAVGWSEGSLVMLQLDPGDWTKWKTVTGPQIGTSIDPEYQMTSVSCSSPSACTAIGEEGVSATSFALTYDGSQWTEQAVAPDPSELQFGFGRYANTLPDASISCASATSCTVAGSEGPGVAYDSYTSTYYRQGPFILTENRGWSTSVTSSQTQVTPGKTVKFTATVSGPDDGTLNSGEMIFFGPNGELCRAPISNGVASCSTQPPRGAYYVEASLLFGSSSGAEQKLIGGGWYTTEPLVVEPVAVASTTKVDTSVGEVTVGGAVTYSVTVSSDASGSPSGTVSLSAGTTALCTVTLSGGSGSCSSDAAPVGQDTITASYYGDAANYASSGTSTLVVDAAGGASTATTVTASSSDAAQGEWVTYAVTVTSADGTPTGSVAVYAGGIGLCTATLSDGVGSCLSNLAPAGSDAVHATYSGDASFDPSQSTDVSLDVSAAATAAQVIVADAGNSTLASFPTSATGDMPAAATVTDDGSHSALNGPAGMTVDAAGNVWVANCSSGSVSEYSPGTLRTSGSQAPIAKLTDADGSLACPNAVAFDADGNLWVTGGTSNTIVEFTADQLTGASGATPLTPAVTLADDGSGAAISDPDGLAFDADGNLWVANSGLDAESGISSDDVVEYTQEMLDASGSPTPSATLYPDYNVDDYPTAIAFDASGKLWVASADDNVVAAYTPAQLADLATTLDPTPVTVVGTPLRYENDKPAAGSPLNNPDAISFDADGDLWVANAGGHGGGDWASVTGQSSVVEYTPDQLTASGDPTPAALISGTATGLDSASGLAVVEARPVTGAAAATPGTAVSGDRVTYSATVTDSGGSTPSGTVAFWIGNTELCSATLNAGGAQCAATSAPLGTDTVTAVYSGDADHVGAVWTAALEITPQAPHVTFTVEPDTLIAGQNARFSVTINAPEGDTDIPTGTVDVTDTAGAVCSFTLDGGTGSCVGALPAAGAVSFTASYPGDDNFAPATGSASVTVGAVDPASADGYVTGSVFVANAVNIDDDNAPSTVTSYPLSGHGDALATATIAQDWSREEFMLTFDASGDLWSAGGDCGSTAELVEESPAALLAGANATPTATIHDDGSGTLCPTGMAFDAAGDLWVGDNGELLEYTPGQLERSGSPTPAVVISDDGIDIDQYGQTDLNPTGRIAFDSAGDLWVLNPGAGALVEFTPGQLAASGSPQPAAVVTVEGETLGLAFDASGEAWVASYYQGDGELEAFTPSQLSATGSPTPHVKIVDDGSGTLVNPFGLAFDGSGNLWVSDAGSSSVLVYDPDQLTQGGAPTPSRIISGPSTGLDEPMDIAIAHGTSGPTTPTPPAAPAGATSSDSATSTSTSGTAVASDGSLTASATGFGALTIAHYGSDPVAAPSTFSAGSAYFDVHVAAGSAFASLTVENCDLDGADTVYFWDGSGWQKASDQSYDAGASPPCVTVTIGSDTSPSLSQLTGTVFVAGTPTTTPPPTTTTTSPTTTSPTTTTSSPYSVTTVASTTTTPPPPPPTIAPRPTVRVASTKLVAKRGNVTVKVTCKRAACAGTVALTTTRVIKVKKHHRTVRRRQTLVLARARYSAAPERTKSVKLHLNAQGRKLLKTATPHRRIAVTLVVSVRGGKTVTQKAQVA